MILILNTQRRLLRSVMEGIAYQFNCLPFILLPAPWIFTKTLKPAAVLLRELGVHLIIYIDDMLVLAQTKEKAERHAQVLVYLLECLGLVINQKKSMLRVSQIMDFLGLTVATVLMQLRLPAEKMKRFRHTPEEWRKTRGSQPDPSLN